MDDIRIWCLVLWPTFHHQEYDWQSRIQPPCQFCPPVRIFDRNGIQIYQNFMLGDWAWEEVVSSFNSFFVLTSLILQEQDKISADPTTHGSMPVPIILGSDKTTVSVTTGQNEYYPLYMSIGSVHNNIHRAHHGALALVALLAILKSMWFILMTKARNWFKLCSR